MLFQCTNLLKTDSERTPLEWLYLKSALHSSPITSPNRSACVNEGVHLIIVLALCCIMKPGSLRGSIIRVHRANKNAIMTHCRQWCHFMSDFFREIWQKMYYVSQSVHRSFIRMSLKHCSSHSSCPRKEQWALIMRPRDGTVTSTLQI